MDKTGCTLFGVNGYAARFISLLLLLPWLLAASLAFGASQTVGVGGGGASAGLPHTSTVLFIDAGVQDARELVAGVTDGVAVVKLQSGADGVQQIAAALKHYRDLDSIQIISHGAPGEIALGSARVNGANLGRYQKALAAWGSALKPGGDIQLYGCNVAKGSVGDRFVDRIGKYTGAAIAASTDATGSRVLGGNWSLEKRTAPVDVALAINEQVQARYGYLLALPAAGTQNVTAAMANGSSTVNLQAGTVPLTGFTFVNDSGALYTGDTTAGFDGIYPSSLNGTSTQQTDTFTVNADGANLGSFDLTGIDFTNYVNPTYGTAWDYNFTITGYKSGGGTVTTTASFVGTTYTPGNYTNFTGLTGFQVSYTGPYKSFLPAVSLSGYGPPANVTFDKFTIANPVAPAPAPTFTSITPTSGPTTGGTSVTITGTNFTGATSVTFGGVAATSFTVNSSTQITATTPAGAAGITNVAITTPGGTATGTGVYTYTAVAPTVTGISPSSGPTAGGTAVTITGTSFTGATAVTIGGANCTGVTVVSATSITCTTPAGTAGAQNVAVTTAAGTGTGSGLYTYYAAPTVTGISPTGGPTTGGTSVIITGTNFTGATSVTIGGTAVSSFTVNSATQITATAPAGTAGAANVVVTTPGGSGTGTGLYTYYAAPTVTGISPSSGPTTGGTSVIITGTNFTGATSVTIGGTAATSFTVNSATQITATAPAGTAGAANVVVTSPGGSGTGTGIYTYVAVPTVTAISPTGGPTSGGTSVTITGTNFTGATSVTIGGAAVASFTVNSSTQITATTPAGTAGAANVVVTTPGGTGTGTGLYTYYAAPTVASISPTSGSTAGGTSVTITGTNFIGATSVTFGGTAATGVTVVNSTTITATTPAGTAGAVNVVVTTPGGTGTGAGLYTYVASPSVTGISPTGGPTAGGTSVTITGANFTGATSVTIGGAAATSFTVNSATQITATTPAGTAGAADVVVTTAVGSGTGVGLYTYYGAPTVTGISPSVGTVSGGTAVTITGTGFTGATSVTIGGAAATGVTVVNSTTITATTPAGTAGTANVVVTTPGGTGTGSGLYTYATVPGAPTIGTATAGNGQATVTFTAPASNGGSAITSYTATSSPGGLTGSCAGPAACTITVAGLTNGTAYTFTVTATNAIGTGAASAASNAVTPQAVPNVTGITPNGGPTAGGTSVTITGANFTGATSVTIGGVAASSFTVNSATQITATTPAGTAGAANVVVTTAVGSGTGVGLYTYYGAPTVTGISPSAGSTAGGTAVTITGTGFTGATSVTIGGAAATGVTVVNSTTITATTPAGTAGTANVVVTTPGGTGTGTGLYTYATVPGAPTIGTATAGNAQATVTFTAPASNGGSAITAYTATASPGGQTGTCAGPSACTITVTGLTNGTAYTFTVTATNAIGTGSASSASNSVTPAAAPTAPGAPTGVTASAGNAQATVNFTAPVSNGGSAITSYTATSSPGGLTGTCAGPSACAITVSGLTNGTAYTFTVTATNAIGTSTASAASNSVTPVASVPGAPTGVTATAGNAKATVNFTAPASNGGSAITSYTATSSPGGLTGSCAGPAACAITVNGLTNGTAYTFTVTATNAVGTGSASAASNSVTPSAAVTSTAATMQYQLNTPATLDLAPFISGTSVTVTVAPLHGTATVSGTQVTYTPTHDYFGSDSFTYVSSNGGVTSPPAVVTISFAGQRPNPANDANVVSLMNTQTQTAKQFWRAQITNFQQRLELLHQGGSLRRDDSADGFAAGATPGARGDRAAVSTLPPAVTGTPVGTAAAVPVALADNGSTGLFSNLLASTLLSTLNSSSLSLNLASLSGSDKVSSVQGTGLNVWGAGIVRVGNQGQQNGSASVDYTTDGVSFGADQRLNSKLTLGMGVGYAQGKSTIGSDGSKNDSNGTSVVGYGSYQYSPTLFIDGLLGYGVLSLDSNRYVASYNEFAQASRAGSQVFGSLSSGYEYRDKFSVLSPYARYDFAVDRLDAVTESGAGLAALSYSNQTNKTQQISIGLRAETQREMSFGWMLPRVRLEYQHHIEGVSQATVAYADQPGSAYAVAVPTTNTNMLLIGVGSGFVLQSGLNLDFSFQWMHSDNQDTSRAILFRVSKQLDGK